MKLPNNFPDKLDEANILFASCTKCYSGIYDSDTRKILPIEFYALAQYDNNSGIHVFSLNERFEVIDDSLHPTVEDAMSEMEKEGIFEKDWKKVSPCGKNKGTNHPQTQKAPGYR